MKQPAGRTMFGPVSSSAGAACMSLPGEPRVMSLGMAAVVALLWARAGCHMLLAANSEGASENSGMHVGPSVVCAKRANAPRTSSVLTARLRPSQICTHATALPTTATARARHRATSAEYCNGSWLPPRQWHTSLHKSNFTLLFRQCRDELRAALDATSSCWFCSMASWAAAYALAANHHCETLLCYTA